MAENDKSIGVVMMPVFTHRKGQLWLAEKAALDLMHKGDIYADLTATVNFKNKVDARDDRPMTYPLRLVLPSMVDLRSSLWKGATLMSIGRTVEIDQLKGGDMTIIEDLDALPSTGDHVGAQGPRKAEQLGSAAMEALLHAQLDGADLSKIDALLIIDLRVRVAELLISLMGMKASYGKPIYYVGFCETVAEMQWAEQYVQSKVTQLIGSGEIVIPGFTPKPIEVPADVLGDPPAPPSADKAHHGRPYPGAATDSGGCDQDLPCASQLWPGVPESGCCLA